VLRFWPGERGIDHIGFSPRRTQRPTRTPQPLRPAALHLGNISPSPRFAKVRQINHPDAQPLGRHLPSRLPVAFTHHLTPENHSRDTTTPTAAIDR
jgi:hypothetical protein